MIYFERIKRLLSVSANGFALGLCLLSAPVLTSAEEPGCGSLENHYGPFDYRDPRARAEKLPVVEKFHFTYEIRTLTSANKITDDLDYTLRAFPNHPGALDAMARHQLKKPRAADADYRSIDCYFIRATRFVPDDGMVYLIWGIYLHRKQDLAGALAKYKEGEKRSPNSAEIAYNIGLVYFDLGDVEHAQEYADKAYSNGYPLPGLRNKLKSVSVPK